MRRLETFETKFKIENIPSRSSSIGNININSNYKEKRNLIKKLTKSIENMRVTQRMRILNAYDPQTGIEYSVNEMIKLKLIDIYTATYRIPSTGEVIDLNDAIRRELVRAHIYDEQFKITTDYTTERRVSFSFFYFKIFAAHSYSYYFEGFFNFLNYYLVFDI
jgi:hypothetical protein